MSLARAVLDRGFRNVEVTCMELNSDMQERAHQAAVTAGAGAHMRFLEADLNEWIADGTYDVVLASHSLHHVVALEHLFGEIVGALPPDGVLLVNDMIGRNGHMRWPEAQEVIEAIWRNMPDRYKYNQQLARFDPEFVNHDCSTEGFEGVRAQDILPLLLRSSMLRPSSPSPTSLTSSSTAGTATTWIPRRRRTGNSSIQSVSWTNCRSTLGSSNRRT